MNVLVTGSTGFVGSYFSRFFRSQGHRLFGLARSGTDINRELTRLDFSFLKDLPPLDCLIHTAALSNVEYCQSHPEQAYLENVTVTRKLAESLPAQTPVVFFSTDYVYDGRTGNYVEDSPTNPLNVYGQTKLEAEKVLQSLLPNVLILRITLVTGWDKASKNFSTKLIQSLRRGESYKVPTDQIGNPTFMDELVSLVVKCLDSKLFGLYIGCGPQAISRYDFAIKMAQAFGLNQNLILPVVTGELGQIATRPLNSSMIPDRIVKLLGFEFRTLPASLDWLKGDEKNYEKIS